MKAKVALAVAAILLAAQTRAHADDVLLDGGGTAPTPPPPRGLYLVTDVYAGDVVTTSGHTTTYGTATVRQTPGTYARVLGTVSTGESSAFDGRSINPRRRLPDGRLVAGTYYEDFVLLPAGWISVNIVFFQDDALTALQTAATAAPAPTRTPAPAVSPPPSAAASATPRPTRTPAVVTAGVSLAATGPVLQHVEVLRGRAVELWPRAFVNGQIATVTSWRLLDGSGAVVDRTTGAEVPCVAVWLVLPPAGGSFTARFEVTAAGRTIRTSVEIAVRSPALIQ